jgi:1,4-alpha-glucan branching enzyme
MLAEKDARDLLTARHADPFSVLGMHADTLGGLWVRALLPGALTVCVHDAQSGKQLVKLDLRHRDGLFEGLIPRRLDRFEYRLQVNWAHGETSMLADAYSFGNFISDADLAAFSSGNHAHSYNILGAHPLQFGENTLATKGVLFAVWAPNARRVSVVGNFNAWDGRRHMMRNRGSSGVWELFIPHVAAGDHYKFELLDANYKLLPLKADPYAYASEYRPATASIVSALPAITHLSQERKTANQRDAPISIYEVHLGSWRVHADGRAYNWDELAACLPDYAAELGFTHLELMPITEYPYDASWGYQTLGMFSPTSRFGSPEGFARFVQACHAKGIGVLMDWVPAHFPSDAHGLAQFDGTALYEYANPKEGFHRDWNTLIYNFGRSEVRSFLKASALYWLERYGVDGLRVDAVASMLYRDYSRPAGEWIANAHGGRENLEAISLMKEINEIAHGQCPGVMTVAEESTAFPGVSAPTFSGGLGFSFKWNMGWMNDTLKYMQEDPVHRRWHHNKMTFGLAYAFSENFVLPLSHDEVVHGKRSIIGRMPGDEWQRFANLRAYYGFMWGHPGKKLLFMGQEFAQTTEWNHETELPWGTLTHARHSGVQRLVKDLNALYKSEPALHALDCEAQGFEWLDASDADHSIFAWLRKGKDDQVMIIISNFTPVPHNLYRVGVPWRAYRFREALNTDASIYGGSNMGNLGAALKPEPIAAHGHAQSLCLALPPLSTIFLIKQ